MENNVNCDEISAVLTSETYPSFFQNSCTGSGNSRDEEITVVMTDKKRKLKDSTGGAIVRPDPIVEFSVGEVKGWTIDLSKMPKFTEDSLNNKLIEDSETMPDKIALKAYRNKMQGYKLWKEGYVSQVRVKPDIAAAHMWMFLVKASVSASMKTIKYTVYCHMDHETAKVVYAKCTCKAGQGGCCKHVAALLYTLLDYSNLSLSYVPEDVTCTQVLQKWSIPSKKLSGNVAVKFDDLEFVKTDYRKDQSSKRKRTATGSRYDFCATPPFARNITEEDIITLSEAFEAAGKATLFVSCLKGNNYKPCSVFETSCNRKNDQESCNEKQITSSNTTGVDLFVNMSTEIDTVQLDIATKDKIKQVVAVSLEQCQFIEAQTRGLSSSNIWFHERSKRVTASIFGRIMNRREQIFPASIIDTITKRRDGKKIFSASLEWGNEKEKVALDMYKKSNCKHDLEIVESGLIINPQWPWLGASPDGVLVSNGRVVGGIEIKCPFSK